MAKRKPKPGPGDLQEGETAKAFAAFRAYLEMGPGRTTAKVGQELGHRSPTQAQKWSSRWRWVERVNEHEGQTVRVADEAHLDVVARRSRRQAEIAQLHGEATALVAREVVKRVTDDPTVLRKLSPKDLLGLEATLARAHSRAVVTERLALGIHTEQPAEPLPRTQAEEIARRMTDAELEERLTAVDEVAERRKRKARNAA